MRLAYTLQLHGRQRLFWPLCWPHDRGVLSLDPIEVVTHWCYRLSRLLRVLGKLSARADVLQHLKALFQLACVELAHFEQLLVQWGELDPFIALIEGDHLLDKSPQIIIMTLEQLNRLDLPHLLHLDVVKIIPLILLLAALTRAFWFEIALEDDKV